MTEKLTPRVGDRVIVKVEGVTRAGVVVGFGHQEVGPDESHLMVELRIDGQPWAEWAYESDITVVDREPVEWPEGWKRWGDTTARWVGPANHLFICRKGALAELLGTGPEMLARWDELMGEQS